MIDNRSSFPCLLSGGRRCALPRPALMEILNATPDSFSNEGKAVTAENAVSLVAGQADILDVGGESTRPGSTPVSEKEELLRVIPVLMTLRKTFPNIPISIDTSKPAVAYAALANWADILNDVTAMEDPEMAECVKLYQCSVILMHNHPVPEDKDFLAELIRFFRERVDACCEATGLPRWAFILDPGIGFHKTQAQNLLCIRGLPQLKEAFPDNPILIGHSRKSFLGNITGRPVTERGPATIAGTAISTFLGADIIRVHDIPENLDALLVGRALESC